jgi:hypothetical protein
MNWNAGDAFDLQVPIAPQALSCGLHYDARGWVAYCDGTDISFYLTQPHLSMAARCPLWVFGSNFVRSIRPDAPKLYGRSAHYHKVFPDDFRK